MSCEVHRLAVIAKAVEKRDFLPPLGNKVQANPKPVIDGVEKTSISGKNLQLRGNKVVYKGS